MTPNSTSVRTEVQNLLSYLIASEIAVYAQPVVEEHGWVSWPVGRLSSPFMIDRSPSLRQYLHWLTSSHYSALLFDGSLLQISYRFVGSDLVAHRLGFVPCPFEVDPELLQIGTPAEVMAEYESGTPHDVLLRSSVRFDFDLEGAGEGHPASHLTINGSDCRVACMAPLRLGRFVRFVFEHFYPRMWQAHPYLGKVPSGPFSDDVTLLHEEAAHPHLAWSRTHRSAVR